MSDEAPTDDFDRLQAQAVEAIDREDIVSLYVGLIPENGTNEYYFGNTVEEEEELREKAAMQLGMMTRTLADKSAWTVEEVAEHAVKQAESMDLQP